MRFVGVLALVLLAHAPAALASEGAPYVVVAPARDASEARKVAHELARALGVTARVREADPTTSPRALLDREQARALVVVDVAPDAVLLTAYGPDGRSWAPRSVGRAAADPLVLEHVAAAGRSIVSAVLAAQNDAPAPSPAPTSSEARNAPVLPARAPTSSEARNAPVLPARAPTSSEADASAPATTAPTAEPPAPARSAAGDDARRDRPDDTTPDRPVATAVLSRPRAALLQAAFAASSVSPDLPIHPGGTFGAWWLRAPVALGAAYSYFPGAIVDHGDVSLSIAHHTFAAGVRASSRFGAWEVGGAAGPLVELWQRSTRSALPTPTSTIAGAGAFGHASLTYWAAERVGLDAGLSVEVAPWSPRFRDATGADVFSPSLARVRLQLGASLGIP